MTDEKTKTNVVKAIKAVFLMVCIPEINSKAFSTEIKKNITALYVLSQSSSCGKIFTSSTVLVPQIVGKSGKAMDAASRCRFIPVYYILLFLCFLVFRPICQTQVRSRLVTNFSILLFLYLQPLASLDP